MSNDGRDPRYVRYPDGPAAHELTLAQSLRAGSVMREGRAGRLLAPLPRSLPRGIVGTEPFPVPGYLWQVGPDYEIVTTTGGAVVAVYRQDHSLRVHEAHRGKRIAFWMIVLREERRGPAPLSAVWPRTERTWKLTRLAHRELVKRAVERGWTVPPVVLADYPDLADRYGGSG